jgi:predicted dehydrogenase
MDQKIKYATIGTSWITEAFITGTQLKKSMKLNAVFSRDAEKARKFGLKFGCDTIFNDIQELAAYEGIDAVYIASPNSLHYSQSKLFLQNGKHVLCEKPITVTPAEYEELTELADKNKLIYLEALMIAHHPEREKIKQALEKIGNITTARLDFSQLSSRYQSMLEGKTPNVFNPAMAGGCLMDMGVYCVFPAVDWFGIPDKIFTFAGKVSSGVDGYLNSLFIYSDKQVDISLSKLGQSVLGCEILGDAGTITIGFIVEMRDVFLVKRDGKKETVIRNYSRSELMSSEAESFCSYISHFNTSEKEYRHVQNQTLKVLRVLDQIKGLARINENSCCNNNPL